MPLIKNSLINILKSRSEFCRKEKEINENFDEVNYWKSFTEVIIDFLLLQEENYFLFKNIME